MARFGTDRIGLSRRRVAITCWVAVTLVVATLVVLAVHSRGVPAEKADLNDGGVWVTDGANGLLGRENRPVQQLDYWASPVSPGDPIDVLQSAEAILAVSGTSVTPVDPNSEFRAQATVSVKSAPVLGGDVVAVNDRATGRLWATHLDTVTGQNNLDAIASTAKPITSVPAGGKLAVTSAGDVAVVTGSDVTTVPSTGSGFGSPSTAALDPRPSGDVAAVTTVGDTVVWLDAQGNVGFDGHSVPVGAGAVLQQSSGPAQNVLVATPTKLLSIDLGSGDASTLTTVTATTAAAPVNLGGCAWGLWQTDSLLTAWTSCDGSGQPVSQALQSGARVVYRVNRDSLLINDLVNGDVWSFDGQKIKRITDWKSLSPQNRAQKTHQQKVRSSRTNPPQAVPDKLGVRDSATTTLHVLDNDLAPKGSILTVADITQNSSLFTAQAAPDRQSILVSVNKGVTGQLTFSYTVDDGEATNPTSAPGTVTLTVHPSTDPHHAAPTLRQGFAKSKPPTYPVAVGRSVQVPVLSDWRDPAYGDPVQLAPDSVKAPIGAASATPDGQLRYIAPADIGSQPKTIPITYAVTTGGDQTTVTVPVTVYPGSKTQQPTAQDDVAIATAGSPITIHPLDNDVPGADPLDPNAKLEISGQVSPQPGLTVSPTDGSDSVTITPTRANTYHLGYTEQYGAGGTSTGSIKLIVVPQSKASNKPIATPDQTAVHGTSPMTVDVLANDFDPRGRLLVVQHAEASDPSQLQVAVIDGRWLRVSSVTGHLDENPMSISYTISNGDAPATTTLSVTQLPAIDPKADVPDVEPDEVTVRSGSSAEIPVLDNDSTPSGAPIGLVPDPTVVPGTLPITIGPKGSAAYLDGKYIRFVAPAGITTATDAHFSYDVENTSSPGRRASGQVTVHIQPAPVACKPDQAPTPAELDGRVVEGDRVSLRLPVTGQDPDGDPVTITGIGDPATKGSVPSLGDVDGYSADTLTYQSFPGETGEDSFVYWVTDPCGRTSSGTVRVTIVPPGAPQTPIAVDDSVTADPGRDLNIEVLANDLFGQGTVPTVSLPGAPSGVSLEDGMIHVAAGSYGDALNVRYTVSNGLASSSANLVVRFEKDYDNPPVAGPVIAKPVPGSDTVVAKVLDQVSDIDDDASHLTITGVDGLDASAIHGGEVTLPVSDHPTVWTYHVKDAEKGQAVGSIYVAGRPSDAPYALPGKVIHVPLNGDTTIKLAQYVGVRPGRSAYLTTDNQIFKAPEGLFDADTPTKQSLKLTGKGTAGPGALTFQVADDDTPNASGVASAIVSIPVVVGKPDPVLTCPGDPIPVPESGDVSLDIAAVCHLWRDPADTGSLSYSASVSPAFPHVDASADGSTVEIKAVHAQAGHTGTIKVSIDGTSATSTLRFTVYKLPPAALAPIPTYPAKAGETLTVPLGQYVLQGRVPASAFEAAILGVTGSGPKASISGTSVVITPPAGEHNTYTYTVKASDSGNSSDRIATGTFKVAVTDVPSWTSGPHVVGDFPQSDKVTLAWTAPDDGNLPIQRYEVLANGSKVATCGGTTCTAGGLKNGKQYTFTVVAYNADGASKPSPSVVATPDRLPDAVTNLKPSREGDRTITYTWTKPVGDFSPVTGYLVSWTGNAGYVHVGAATKSISVANGASVKFTVRPINSLGADHPGPATSDSTGIASGKPATPTMNPITGTNVAGGGSKAFVVSWGQVAPNGRGQTHYQLSDNGSVVQCPGATTGGWFTGTSCTDTVPNDGKDHSYTVKSANDAGVTPTTVEGSATTHRSAASTAQKGTAAGTPSGFSNTSLTGADRSAKLAFTVGASNGAKGIVTCSGMPNCGPFDVGADGGTVNTTITGLTNGTTYNLTLTYCNGATADSATNVDPCTTQGPMSVTPYGAIGQASLRATASSNNVSAVASVDPNGAAVNVVITNTTNGSTHSCSYGNVAGTQSCSWADNGLSYSTTYNYKVVVSDASGNGRSSTSATDSATTGPAPGSVSLMHGSGFNDPSICPANGQTCYYLKIDLEGFVSPATCHFDTNSNFTGTWTDKTGVTNGVHQYASYMSDSGNYWVSVHCWNGTQSVTDTYNNW